MDRSIYKMTREAHTRDELCYVLRPSAKGVGVGPVLWVDGVDVVAVVGT